MPLRRLLCRAALLAWPALPAASVAAAPPDQPETAEAPPAAKGKKAADSLASIRVEILATKPGNEQPAAVKSAVVKMVGEDVWYKTDDSGKTQRFTGPPGPRELLVRPPGSNPCSVAVVLKKGDQDVTILVQTSPELACRVKPAP